MSCNDTGHFWRLSLCVLFLRSLKHYGNTFKKIELTGFFTYNDRAVISKIIFSAIRTSVLFDSNPLEAVVTFLCFNGFCFHFCLLLKKDTENYFLLLNIFYHFKEKMRSKRGNLRRIAARLKFKRGDIFRFFCTGYAETVKNDAWRPALPLF